MGTKENSAATPNAADKPTNTAVQAGSDVPPKTTTTANSTPALMSSNYGKILLTLQNCLLPEDKLTSTPSNIDGLDSDTEIDLRIVGCELIQSAGILLKLPQVVMVTGQIIFQRFYYCKSLVRYDMETTAMACVCLASKIEEAPRNIRDVINVFNRIKQVHSQKSIQPVILDSNYVALKNQVIKSERRVLKELGFCVHVKHPHKMLLVYLKVLGFVENTKLTQLSWNYMNDSLRSDVFIHYEPETVVCACVYLSARELKVPLPTNPAWFTLFRVNESSIRDICRCILKLYSRPHVKPEILDKKVEELKKKYEESRTKARISEADGNTPSPPLGKGHGNAWGGFISRNPNTLPATVKSPKNSKSPSNTPERIESMKHSKRKKRSRSRSQSPSRSRKVKKSSRHRSSSHKAELKKKYEESRTKARISEADGNTPSPPLGKGHGNAWGGFISRNPNTLPATVKSPKNSKSPSSTPERIESMKHSKRKKRSRSRSQSPSRSRKVKKSSRHRSSSHKAARSHAREYRSRSRSRERENDNKSSKHRSKHIDGINLESDSLFLERYTNVLNTDNSTLHH